MNVRDDRCEDRQQGEHERQDDEKGVPDVPIDFFAFPFGVFEAVDVVHVRALPFRTVAEILLRAV